MESAHVCVVLADILAAASAVGGDRRGGSHPLGDGAATVDAAAQANGSAVDAFPAPDDRHAALAYPDVPFLLDSTNSALARAVATARRVAPSNVTILLTGESGTGKSVLATRIHEWSQRRAGPFVRVSRWWQTRSQRKDDRPDTHRAAHDDPRWRSAAEGGTLFFDDISALPSAPQAMLIRFLDEDEGSETHAGTTATARPRVIAATQRDLEKDVRDGRFRLDLFFRLNAIRVHLPPLRERQRDLRALSNCILARLCARQQRARMRIAPEVRRAFAAYGWPGNLRELVTVLEGATALGREDFIRLDDLPERVAAAK
jgi:DNA-binding NtrC family response regulator